MTLTKIQLVQALTHHLQQLNKKTAVLFVDIFFDILSLALEKEARVNLPNFGTFYLRTKKARPGRNPRTGEPKVITARKVIIFKPSQYLKNQVAQLATVPKYMK